MGVEGLSPLNLRKGAMYETAVLILVVAIFAFGVAGCFLPVVPGNVVVWLGVMTHKLVLGDASVAWGFVALATAATLLALVLDGLCSYWGARRFGSSWQGAVGAVAGAVLGLAFLGIPGLIVGPVLGAVAVEMVKGRDWRRARRAGVGTLVGGLVAFVFKVTIALGVAGGFFLALPD